MPAHGAACILVVLRGDKCSSAATQISHRRRGGLLRDLPLVGWKRVYSTRFVCLVNGCPLGRMVVAKGIPSLSVPLLYGCCGDRPVLFTNILFVSLSDVGFRA